LWGGGVNLLNRNNFAIMLCTVFINCKGLQKRKAICFRNLFMNDVFDFDPPLNGDNFFAYSVTLMDFCCGAGAVSVAHI
jgi:hypothetical protein